ncbi:hypothetical protein M6B22_16930 [Jatrophihabitans cynanchi]|uniref:HIRAN domain-containing protein n=1 Tax=Jatrophihabitans cynanchi TaxID=2944128 RepID=A0ABY7JY16_9ACTN|nr:HIRAN domain-containing protein [Jatrophihabitans sp. SB3-54]WAX56207.1 hypothetical protein M6B22_16930 [Jatrophihabitans sp. SB3-54]
MGQLHASPGGRFEFSYLPAAKAEPGFVPLAQFPRLGEVYESDVLPAFFANRVMSRQRETYPEYAHQLGLNDATATPVEILVRSGGSRATDTFHIVDDLRYHPQGAVVSRFLASGVRHLRGATDRIASLRAEQELVLRDEPDNPVNARAILIDERAGEPVGYVPDWLADDVHELRSASNEVRIFVEQANPDARPHLQLLCRLEAHGVRTD